jgi:hypothetical protein
VLYAAHGRVGGHLRALLGHPGASAVITALLTRGEAEKEGLVSALEAAAAAEGGSAACSPEEAGRASRRSDDDAARVARNLLALAAADVVIAAHDELVPAEPAAGGGVATRAAGASPDGPARVSVADFFWHRIVVDEIQLVGGSGVAAGARNLAKRVDALCELQAAHKWPTSGTPMEATAALHPILRFLRAQPFGDDALWASVLAPALRAVSDEHAALLAGAREAGARLNDAIDALKAAVAAYSAMSSSHAAYISYWKAQDGLTAATTDFFCASQELSSEVKKAWRAPTARTGRRPARSSRAPP